jgi:single-stranded-DNA-specific exonuclease
MTEINWILPNKIQIEEKTLLAEKLQVPFIVAQLLVDRGINTFESAKSFFRPSLDELHDPFLMEDMDKAVHRLSTAIDNNQSILIYGDYDVDGTTSVALMVSYLSNFSSKISHYQPDRYSEGYGISTMGIEFARDNKIDLIIALDCGITSIDKVDLANEFGIDVIICDHHTPIETLPKATAILNPKKKTCNYPYKELCGCGIGFKLIQAWAKRRQLDEQLVLDHLDLVAIAIGADIVPITGENRILAHFGLLKINNNPRIGIRLLLELNSKKKANYTISDLVFIIAPRINAAGRIDHAKYAVQLLLCNDYETAEQMNTSINEYNVERRSLDKEITIDALQELLDNEYYHQSYSTVVWSESYHKGVVGIVASRLIEKHYKPTIVLALNENEATGSARSVDGFDVYEAINSCKDLLIKFGGHKYAAGLSLKKENLELFRDRFEDAVRNKILPEQRIPSIYIDAEISASVLVTDGNGSSNFPKIYRITEQFAPFGPQNMKPVFLIRGLIDNGYSKIVGETHLKLNLKCPKSKTILEGIGFGLYEHFTLLEDKKPIDICFNLDINDYLGNQTLQLKILDIKPSILDL